MHEFTRMICNNVAGIGCDLWLNGMSFGSNENIIRTSINASALKNRVCRDGMGC